MWERLAEGEQFDGMESWLPFLDGEARVLPDLLAPGAQVVLVEPRRIRDRGVQLLDEEAALAETLAATWGAKEEEESFPRLHVPFERLLVTARPASPRCPPSPRAPRPPRSPCAASTRWRGTRRGWRPGSRVWSARATPSRCAPHGGGGERLSAALASRGRARARARRGARHGRGRVVAAPLTSGFILPDAKVAVLSETDVTGRRVPHRRAAPAGPGGRRLLRRPRGRELRRAPPARCGALRGGHDEDHGRDHPRLPDPAVPGVGPPLPAGGPDRGHHALQRGRVPDALEDGRAPTGSAPGPGLAPRRARWRPSWWSSTAAGWRSTARPFGPDTPWQAEMEASFGFVETEDQLKAIADVKADMEEPRPMDRLICGDVGFGKTEVAIRAAFKAVQDGTQAAVLAPTTLLASQHAQTFADRYAPYPVRVELLSRFLSPAQQRAVVQGLADGSVDVVVGTHRLLAQDVAVQGARPPGRRRGAAVRGLAQGDDQAHGRGRRRADADRQPDPAHAGDGPDRDPRPLHGQHPAGRPAAHPHLRR